MAFAVGRVHAYVSEVSTIFTVRVFQRAHGTPVAVIIVLASVSVL